MAVTCLLGFVQMYHPLGMALESEPAKGVVLTRPKGFWKNMFIVGSMRFSTVLLGMIPWQKRLPRVDSDNAIERYFL